MIEYVLYPERGSAWGGPFNGQQKRLELFLSLVSAGRPAAIIETGTYLGTSTEFMAKAVGLPIFTVEAEDRNFGFARMRLRRFHNVKLAFGDSREFLANFVKHRAADYSGRSLLFYLDAHWGADLPLSGELAIVFSSLSRAIVLIDDFQVPDDAGYKYDDYGTAGALTRDYIAPVVRQYRLTEFYPRAPSATESGLRRGCVVLARDPGLVEALSRLPVLRKWPA
jgi:hypothetical protein